MKLSLIGDIQRDTILQHKMIENYQYNNLAKHIKIREKVKICSWTSNFIVMPKI